MLYIEGVVMITRGRWSGWLGVNNIHVRVDYIQMFVSSILGWVVDSCVFLGLKIIILTRTQYVWMVL